MSAASLPAVWQHVPVLQGRHARLEPMSRAHVDGLRVTMVGHATLLIQVAGRNILTDPVWSDRCSPVRFAGPRRVTAPGIAFADLPRIDTVLLQFIFYFHKIG